MNKYSYEFVDWCISAHRDTNHFYDEILPYEFHLTMVADEVMSHYANIGDRVYFTNSNVEIKRVHLICGAFSHDVIKDARKTYSDVKKASNSDIIANIAYACTEEKGRNRKEGANDKYYKEIRDTAGAPFIKICDRIANVKYGKMMGSSQFEMYRKENDHFIESVFIPELEQFKLKDTLIGLFA